MHRVAVIGAGASGLAALRHLATKPDLYTAVCYEQADEIGGQWVYTEETGYDDKGRYIFSSMYKGCTTNVQKELLQFLDFPFSDHLHSSVPQADVRRYLEDYTDHFQLRKFIRFNTFVTKVSPLKGKEGTVKWEISTKNACDHTSDKENMDLFDNVFICTGVFCFPNTPEILGQEKFQGIIIHSHDYRVPEVFKNMRVVVLGSGPSAQDISLEVGKVAKEVVISHHSNPLNIPFLPNMRQAGDLERLTSRKAIFQGGEEYDVDALILCTGYQKNFPFLAPECHIRAEGMNIYPLYKHILHTEYPSLAFINIMEITVAFPHAELQVKFAMSAWEGVQKLPSREDMEADIRRDQEWRLSIGYPAHRPHLLGALARVYENELALLGKFDPIPENTYSAFEQIVDFYFRGFLEYIEISPMPKTATGEYDLEKLATFPSYVENLRSGKIDRNTPMFQ